MDAERGVGILWRVGEVILAYRTPKPRPVIQARSTLIVSAIQTLRAHGIYDRYSELLSPGLRQEMMSLVAGLWIPGELALEHFRTMDKLGLSKSTIEAVGAEVAERGAKTTLAVVPGAKSERDPWKMLVTSHRNLDTNWRGSDIMVVKEGPQHAVVIWAGQPCASIPYFVTSWGAFLRAVTNQYCTSANHRIDHEQSSSTAIAIVLTWV